MKSIIQTEKECYLCGNVGYGYDSLECHHIFSGTSNRRKSEEYGLKVWLCGYKCHRYGKHAVHQNKAVDLMLKRIGQAAFENKHGSREDFLREFGRNYL